MLTAADPYCGIDLDHCIEDGTVALWASAIVDRFRSYTEVTPSGTGLRIWIRGKLAAGGRNRVGSIELYDRDRYFTATSEQLPDTPNEIAERQAELDAFYAELFPAPLPSSNQQTSSTLNDFQVLDLARRARNGAKLEQLLGGSIAGYQSASEADLALLGILVFYTQDPGQLERLWRGSGLWREKQERADYRERTVAKALRELREVYQPTVDPSRVEGPPAPTEAPESIPPTPWLTPLSSVLGQPPKHFDWLVEDFLIRGGIGVFGAKPKVAKTTLLTQFALAVSRGAKFLGRKTIKGPVIYLALEEDEERVLDRFRRLGATTDDEVHLRVGIAAPGDMERLHQAIKELGAILAIIDPIQRLTRLEDGNDYSQVSNATDPLIAMARSTSCGIIFSHHLGKTDREGGDQLLGSTALFGAVDTSFVIRKREEDKVRTLETIQRYGRSLEPAVLGYDQNTGMAWLEATAEEYQVERDQLKVLEAVAEQVEPMTREDLFSSLSIGWPRAQRAVEGLLAKRYLERRGEGRRSSPYRYRALVRPEQMKTTFLNTRDVSSQLEKETGEETGEETDLVVFKSTPHGFLSPLKGGGRGNLAPIVRSLVSESLNRLPEQPSLSVVGEVPRLEPRCPSCGSTGLLTLDVQTGERQCSSCSQIWYFQP